MSRALRAAIAPLLVLALWELSVRFSTEPSRFCHSVMSATTGCGVAGSNSVLFASVRPALCRA